MLSILPYHRATTRYFQDMAPVWDFFASHKHKSEQLVEFKTDLLKNSYKFDVDGDPDIYSKVQMVKDKLGLHIPVFVYQAQHSEEMNASIVYLNEEAHIVFTGRLIDAMTQDELLAIIAHELSHVELYRQLNGAVEVADRIITAIANHSGSTPAHYETARLFKLYTEIFCDRGAYLVTGNYAPIISSLVKIATGLQTVNPDSYIKQADEIFTVDANTKTMGITHPENFIRARAIWLWHTKGAEAESQVEMMIEGKTSLDELDLFQQKTVSGQTQKLIQLILQPRWMQTAHTIALSKQYFSSQDLSGSIDINQFAELVERLHPDLKEYLAYVLYDFATTDKELEDLPLGYCFFLADGLKIQEAFGKAIKKEQKLTDKKVSNLKKQSLASYHQQELQPEPSIINS